MKVLHGTWTCSLKQINRGTIKISDTPYIKVLQVLLRECFPWGVANQVDNTKLQFNLDAFNVCNTQVHKTKYSMNMQYLILDNPKIIWAPYHLLKLREILCGRNKT